jgi:hypothetical protein
MALPYHQMRSARRPRALPQPIVRKNPFDFESRQSAQATAGTERACARDREVAEAARRAQAMQATTCRSASALAQIKLSGKQTRSCSSGITGAPCRARRAVPLPAPPAGRACAAL